tara:strand:- start:2674 stop:3279 length:606 start_codon:yes stop_codon:yes gene_type:complete
MAKGASINIKGLKRELDKKAGPIIRRKLNSRAKQIAQRAKRQLLSLFDSHSITREIEGGSSASNSSGTLGGVGNLFTFIGFEEGSQPVEIIRRYLEEAIEVEAVAKGGKDLEFVIRFKIPSKDQIESMSPVPWAPGRSWVRAMELGLSGLGQYLFKQSPVSRSGGGIQVKGQVRASKFSNQAYMSEILNQVNDYIRKEFRR